MKTDCTEGAYLHNATAALRIEQVSAIGVCLMQQGHVTDTAFSQQQRQLFYKCKLIEMHEYATANSTTTISQQSMQRTSRILACAHDLLSFCSAAQATASAKWLRARYAPIRSATQRHASRSRLRACRCVTIALRKTQDSCWRRFIVDLTSTLCTK